MKATSFVSILAAVLLVGCAASTYELSEVGRNFRATLTNSEALNVVRRLTAKNSEQAGVCSAHTNEQFQQAEPVTVTGANLVFNSYYKVTTGAKSNVSSTTVTTTVSYQMLKGTFKTDLVKLNKIRILTDIRGSGCTTAPPGGYIVMIDNPGIGDAPEGRANAVMINVSARNLDRLVAALTFLSPNARLIQGAGL